MSLNKEIVAIDLLSSGICPMNCRYCYIPKNKEMEFIQKEIIEDLKSGKFIDRIKIAFGDRLEYLGLWGTEPMTTIPLITEKIHDILKACPNLKKLSYSTSGILNPVYIIDLIKAIKETAKNRSFVIDHQISLDGPKWLVDMNRMVGAFDVVVKNFKELVLMLNNVNLPQNIHMDICWKPTIDIENMKKFNEDEYKIIEYTNLFKELRSWFDSNNKNPNVFLANSELPSLVLPGKYTSTDGKIFAEFLRKWHKYGISTYTIRLARVLNLHKLLYNRMIFTCSGGRSNYALGKNIYMCHRSLFLDDERYINSIVKGESSIDAENWDISLFNKKTIDLINDKYIASPDDVKSLNRMAYVFWGHSAFWRFETGYMRAMLEELVRAGQADRELIENEGLFELFMLFVSSASDCPMENLLNTGSTHLTPVSVIRLWANGAFKELLKNTVK